VLGMGCKLKHLQSSSSHRNKRQQDKGIKQIHLSAPLMHCSPHYFCNHTHKHTHTHKHRHLGYDAFSRSSTLPNAATQLKTCRGRATPPSRARPIRSTLPQDLDLDPEGGEMLLTMLRYPNFELHPSSSLVLVAEEYHCVLSTQTRMQKAGWDTPDLDDSRLRNMTTSLRGPATSNRCETTPLISTAHRKTLCDPAGSDLSCPLVSHSDP